MAERTPTADRWVYGLAYVGLMSALTLLHIMPIEITRGALPAPDLLTSITFAWVLRRPQYVPTLLVALVFLVSDVLFMRPLGLWTALTVLAVEFLRRREANVRERTFPLEWAMVAGVLLAMTLANRLVLTVFLVNQAGLGLSILQMIITILAYPLVVLMSRFVLSVQKMTPGETDARGRPR